MTQAVKEIHDVRKKAPSKKALLEAFGESAYKERATADGRTDWKLSVKLRDDEGKPTKHGKLYDDMMKPLIRAECERAQRKTARTQYVPMARPDGETLNVKAHLADQFAAQGYGHKPYWGKGKRVAWIDSAGKYHRAED